MARHAVTNKGFSLIELVIAMALIIISMLAAMSATISTVRTNLDNEVRTVATRAMTQTAEALLAMSFTDPNLTDGNHNRIPNDPAQTQLGIPNTIAVVRGSQQNFTIQWNVTTLTPQTSMQVDISVSYTNRNINYTKNLTLFKHATI